MVVLRQPGPTGNSNFIENIGDGTLCLQKSSIPGVVNSTGRLCGPAIPKAVMDPPIMAEVRATRQLLESAKHEAAAQSEVAAKNWKEWEESRKRLGPAGDPSLKQKVELCWRKMESIMRPALKAYSVAMMKAIEAGHISMAGSNSAEKFIKNLLELEGDAQHIGDEVLISPGDWADVIDKMAQFAYRKYTIDKDPRGLNLAVLCLQLADMYGAQNYKSVISLQAVIDDSLSDVQMQSSCSPQ